VTVTGLQKVNVIYVNDKIPIGIDTV